MRLYLDTEFNGFGGELISMALVADDGREWYALMPEPRTWNEWVFDNVFPILRALPRTIEARTRDEFITSLHIFLKQFDEPEIVADWYTDLVHFFACFEGRDYGSSLSYQCTAKLYQDVPGYAPAIQHNALSDARAIRDALSRAAHG